MPYRTILLFALSLVPVVAFAADGPAFVALTGIPALQNAGNADKLPDFLNGLYRIAIGFAAVLAVLQIIRAGIMYMGGDSVTEKKEAKSLISLSIGGLVLILSPVIVFSIINPKILELKIDGIQELASTTSAVYSAGGVITTSGEASSAACSPYRSIGYTAESRSCTSLGNGFGDISPICCNQLSAGNKCCGSRTATTISFGWKAWYDVPDATGKMVRTLLKSGGVFGTSVICTQNATTPTNLPAGSKFVAGSGEKQGFVCTCGSPLGQQGDACKPW